MKISRQIFIMLLLFITQSCLAVEHEQNIQAQLTAFLNNYSDELAEQGYRSEFKVGNIDPRLNIKSCTNPLKLSFNRKPLTQNNVTIKAECIDLKPWKLYISIRYDLFKSIITASEPISRGHVILNSQLQTKEQLVNKGHYISYTDKDKIIGMVARRSIRSGAIIQPRQLTAPNLVKRGDNVIIIASNNNISVKMNGTALMDGHLGEQISIKNNRSNRIIQGRVTKTGYVSIAL